MSTHRQSSRSSVKAAVAFTATAQAWKMVVTFISSIILARILSPADYGLMAAVTPVIAFAVQMQNLGLTQAIVQKQEITRSQLDALFWISMFVSALFAVVVALSAGFLADFFHDPRLRSLYWVGSITIVLSAVAAQPTALLSRNLRFGAIATRDMIADAVAVVAAIAIALIWRSYWALIVNMLLSSLIVLVLSARAAKWVPGQPRYDPEVKKMVHFGAGVSSNNLLNFFSRNADNLIIARSASAHDLGIYSQAYRLLMYPLTQAVYPIGRVLLPTLSRRLGEPKLYERTYKKSVISLLLLTHPGLLLTIIFSEPFVVFLLGQKWVEVSPILSILGIAGLHQLYTSTNGWLYVSQGRGRDYAAIGAITSAVTVASFFVGVQWGTIGVASTYVITEILFRFPFTIWHVGRSGPISHAIIFKMLYPHIVALAVTAAILFSIHFYCPNPKLVYFVLIGILSYLIYLLSMVLFREPRDILLEYQERVRRLVSR